MPAHDSLLDTHRHNKSTIGSIHYGVEVNCLLTLSDVIFIDILHAYIWLHYFYAFPIPISATKYLHNDNHNNQYLSAVTDRIESIIDLCLTKDQISTCIAQKVYLLLTSTILPKIHFAMMNIYIPSICHFISQLTQFNSTFFTTLLLLKSI